MSLFKGGNEQSYSAVFYQVKALSGDYFMFSAKKVGAMLIKAFLHQRNSKCRCKTSI